MSEQEFIDMIYELKARVSELEKKIELLTLACNVIMERRK